MHLKLPQLLLFCILLICNAVPVSGQINPIKTANEIGKNLPVKKDPPASSASTSSSSSSTPAPPTNTPANNTNSSLDAAAESSPAYNLQPLETELAKYKTEYQIFPDQRSTARDNASNTVRYMSDLFKSNALAYVGTGNVEADIAKHKEKLLRRVF